MDQHLSLLEPRCERHAIFYFSSPTLQNAAFKSKGIDAAVLCRTKWLAFERIDFSYLSGAGVDGGWMPFSCRFT